MSGVFSKLAGVFSSNAARLKRAEDMIAGGDRTAAFKLLVPLAQAGLPRAEFLVGRSYLEGAGVPHSVRDGAYWLERAAEHGDTQAPGLLAALHVQGLIGPNTSQNADASGLSVNGASSALFGVLDTAVPDYVQALKWAKRAAAAAPLQRYCTAATLTTLTPGTRIIKRSMPTTSLRNVSTGVVTPSGLIRPPGRSVREALRPATKQP
jgi:TPR repeat protein